MHDRYTIIQFRGRPFYMDTTAFSPRPVDFCTGRVVEKGLAWITGYPKARVSVLDFCSGQGCVGLSLFEEAEGRIERVGYVDVNYFNLLALEKTLAELRDFGPEVMARHEPILSNALKCLPAGDRYDLILCNPPHRDVGDGHPMTVEFSLKNLFLVDPGWRLHHEFYAKVHEHLLPGGESWFIELQGSPRERFEEMIAANPRLEYLGHHAQEKLGDEVPRYYWMGCRLRATEGDT
jgi:methylase of polypeptide subunit release factors